jgi:hypothetical protein
LTKSSVKRGRGGPSKHYTMRDLLWSYMDTGNEQHGEVWRVFASTMFGKNLLTWSPGLRDWLGMLAEQTDEEVAADDHDLVVVLAVLGHTMWGMVRGSVGPPKLRVDRRAELLGVANNSGGDPVAVGEWLVQLHSKHLKGGDGDG